MTGAFRLFCFQPGLRHETLAPMPWHPRPSPLTAFLISRTTSCCRRSRFVHSRTCLKQILFWSMDQCLLEYEIMGLKETLAMQFPTSDFERSSHRPRHPSLTNETSSEGQSLRDRLILRVSADGIDRARLELISSDHLDGESRSVRIGASGPRRSARMFVASLK
jgi:hypothetical protein